MISTLILSRDSSVELRSIQTAVMLMDDAPCIVRCSMQELPSHQEILRNRTAMAVGSVEFVREAFSIGGITEPKNLSYHNLDHDLLKRHVRPMTISELVTPCFVKPATTKQFTGFVLDPHNESTLDEHDREQLSLFSSLPPATPIWSSDPVSFLCEWRYYVMDNEVIGKARYDPDGSDDAPTPDTEFIKTVIKRINLSHPYALDVGITSNGENAVVECNDAWAIGLYGSSLKPKDYYRFLSTRWLSL